jgi:hypothetical protein
MALTVVQFETILIKRTGGLLTAVGLDGTTVDGDNPDLVDPMGYAIRQAGGSVTTITNIVDADLTGFAETEYDQLFDTAELRVLQNCYSVATTLIDTEIGPRDEKWSNLAARLEKLIDAKQKAVDKQYNLALPTMSTGSIDLNFQQHGDDTVV